MINLLRELPKSSILFLTGAGLSVDSGIPTFRGVEGAKSKANRSFFDADPKAYWDWATSRFKTDLEPNEGHKLIDGTGCEVITQNVDGLHRPQYGNVLEIHGNNSWMLCSNDCKNSMLSILPRHIGTVPICKKCHSPMIPKILNFDENYEESLFEEAMDMAYCSSLLICVGTTISTGLPIAIWSHYHEAGKPIIFINPENIFVGRQATHFIQKTAIEALPEICEAINYE